MAKKLAIVSGGIDSTVLMYDLIRKGHTVEAITFDYGQYLWPWLEACLKYHTSKLGIKLVIVRINAPWWDRSNPIFTGARPPVWRDDPSNPDEVFKLQIGDIKKWFDKEFQYIEGRNLLFFSYAGIYAATHGYRSIVNGFQWGRSVKEVGGSGIPVDNTKRFADSMTIVANDGGAFLRDIRFESPYWKLNKDKIVRRAVKLGVNLAMTISCEFSFPPCGYCTQCQYRAKVFEKYKLKEDPKKLDTMATITPAAVADILDKNIAGLKEVIAKRLKKRRPLIKYKDVRAHPMILSRVKGNMIHKVTGKARLGEITMQRTACGLNTSFDWSKPTKKRIAELGRKAGVLECKKCYPQGVFLG